MTVVGSGIINGSREIGRRPLRILSSLLLGSVVKLQTRKRLLNALSVGCLLTGVVAVAAALTAPVPTTDDPTPRSKPQSQGLSAADAETGSVDAKLSSWQRLLRRPLYDPPPVPKKIVKKKPRPIKVKLMGTILEAENSQAFVKLSNGAVELRRVGDQVSDDPRDGQIALIMASEIVIRRDDGEFHVTVDGQH